MKRVAIASTVARLTVKPRMRKCKVCFTSFLPQRMGQKVCGWLCAELAGKLETEKQERQADKVRRVEIKTLTDWLADTQKVFNQFIRCRDANLPCICCGGTGGTWSRGGIWDAGHFRSRGSAGHLRFDERNVHRQLKQCNSYGAGRHADFRIGLIGRIGIDAVEALEADQAIHKWTIAELVEIKALYRNKLKELKAGE